VISTAGISTSGVGSSAARAIMAIEEHGAGKQLVRFRITPRISMVWAGLTIGLAVLAVAAGLDHAWLVAGVLGIAAAALAVGAALDAGRGLSALVTIARGEAT
jgi:hypothetical protein